MQAIIRGSREHVADIIDNDSPVNEVEEAFEKATLSITKEENNKVVKGELEIKLVESFFVYDVLIHIALIIRMTHSTQLSMNKISCLMFIKYMRMTYECFSAF